MAQCGLVAIEEKFTPAVIKCLARGLCGSIAYLSGNKPPQVVRAKSRTTVEIYRRVNAAWGVRDQPNVPEKAQRDLRRRILRIG